MSKNQETCINESSMLVAKCFRVTISIDIYDNDCKCSMELSYSTEVCIWLGYGYGFKVAGFNQEFLPAKLEIGAPLDGIDITKHIVTAKSSEIIEIDDIKFKMRDTKGLVSSDGTMPVILERVMRVR